jgi:branched-chain amino acid transport system permease protein
MGDILVGKNINKYFGGLQALKQVNVQVEERKITGIIGPNGAGKTTLFNVLSGFIKPDEGQVLFKGMDITKTKPHDIVHLGMARSWQGLRLFDNLSALENIAMSIPRHKNENPLKLAFSLWKKNKEKIEKAYEILKAIDMQDRADRPVKESSYAEQKLVAIGRLLATEAEALLLDEPTSGLDEKTVFEVIVPLLKNIVSQQKKTIFLVEHSIKLVFSMCDCVICLNEGNVVACGDPVELRTDDDLKRAFFYGA